VRAVGADPDTAALLEIAPRKAIFSIERLARLADGAPVDVERTGPYDAVSPLTDLTAYRVIQEALTNAGKHVAGAHVQLTIAVRDNRLEVIVADDGGHGRIARASTGLGLISLGERVRAADGTLQAGPSPEGGFRVHAVLPCIRATPRDPDQRTRMSNIRVLLETIPGIEIVAEAQDGTQAVAQAIRHRPDVVLMDIRIPGLDGIEATRIITHDEKLSTVKVLILTAFETDEHVAEALRAGASGFVGKGINPQELIDAIRTVADGDCLLSPAATRGLINRFLAQDPPPRRVAPALENLAPREREVVVLVATGLSNDEIAAHIGISAPTAKTHVNREPHRLCARL